MIVDGLRGHVATQVKSTSVHVGFEVERKRDRIGEPGQLDENLDEPFIAFARWGSLRSWRLSTSQHFLHGRLARCGSRECNSQNEHKRKAHLHDGASTWFGPHKLRPDFS